MLGFRGPAQPSPTLGDALNAGYLYLEVRCLGWDTHQTVALDVVRRNADPPVGAVLALQGLLQLQRYSITPSARARTVGGSVRPSALAVPRLTKSWNFVGCSTGRLAGDAPLRSLST
jgi:hypothetical protein